VRARAAAGLLAFAVALLATAAALAAGPEGETRRPGEPPGEGRGEALSAAAERGRVLYRTGESASGGEVIAVLGDGAVQLPAASFPCATCHGEDGRGRAEGGALPSDLTWPALTRPYEVRTGDRRRGPYDEAKMTRAIALGVDPSGNRLDSVMPRYRMSKQDADDLVAYLRRLGRDPDPGVSEEAVRLGVLLAPEGSGDEAARAVRSTLEAGAAKVNAAGGVYQRRLELVYHRLPAEAAERAASAAGFLAAERPFALVAPSFFGADGELAALAATEQVPTFGPLALAPPLSGVPDRWVFYLDPGLTGLARALVRHGHALGGDAPAVLAGAAGGAATAEVTAGAQAEARRLEWDLEEVALGDDAASEAAALAARGVEIVVVLAGGGTAAGLLAAATEAGWRPTVLALGPIADAALLRRAEGFGGRLFLAFAALPSDRTPSGVAALRGALAGALDGDGLHGGDAAGPRSPPAALGATEVAAYVALDLLVEGLRRTGRELSRTGLVDTLEKLRDHRTGLMPPLTYGPNRRLGTGGAWVVEVGAAALAESAGATWVELVR
jgi:ABC-type branched-subunit amino acid transport system substrate-binding protein